MTLQQSQYNAVLSAKLRIACIAEKNYQDGLHGGGVDECCVQKVLFAYGFLKEVECYEIDGEDNCWTETEFIQALSILNGLLI